MVHLLNEVAEHRLSDLEIGDHAILHRSYGHDIARRATQHAFRFFSDREHIGRSGLNGHHRWFTQHDSLVSYVNQRISCSQIDPNVIGEQALKLADHARYLTRPPP